MSVNIKNSHELIIDSVERQLIDVKYKMPFYGQLNLQINFNETESIDTIGVNMTKRGMFFYFKKEFLDNLGTRNGVIIGRDDNEKEYNKRERHKMANFILLHEDFHLLFNHPKRATQGRFNNALASLAQDMIINSVIWDDINHNFVSIPRYPDNEFYREKGIENQSMAVFIPEQYFIDSGEQQPLFEELYNWLRDKKLEWDTNSNNPGFNPQPDFGKFGKTGNGNIVETYSTDYIFSKIEENKGQFLDKHLEDEIPEELRQTMVRDMVERLKARGFSSSDVEKTIKKLQKKRKDHLREIKRSISNEIIGNKKIRSIDRPNRRGIVGVKGNRKVKSQINVLLDTSGSMYGMFEKVLEYIFQNDVEINICQVDTAVHSMETVSSMKELQEINVKGLGGTMLQPGIDLITNSKEYNKYNTVILTDGWCDTLDMSKMNGRVLGVTCGHEIPVRANPKKGYKEIKVEKTQ